MEVFAIAAFPVGALLLLTLNHYIMRRQRRSRLNPHELQQEPPDHFLRNLILVLVSLAVVVFVVGQIVGMLPNGPCNDPNPPLECKYRLYRR